MSTSDIPGGDSEDLSIVKLRTLRGHLDPGTDRGKGQRAEESQSFLSTLRVKDAAAFVIGGTVITVSIAGLVHLIRYLFKRY